MTFPGVGRAVFIGGSLGGGTGRTRDWSTYNGTNDTAWQQWIKDDSSALGTTYQAIKGFKKVGLSSSGSFFMGVDNNGTQTIAKFVPDTDDATAGHFTLGSFHNLGTNKVQMVNNGAEMVLTSNVDSGTIVVFNQELSDSGKISGLASSLPNDNWDCTVYETTTSSGGSSSPSGTYNYTEHFWHSHADMIVWYMHTANDDELRAAAHVWLKGNYSFRYNTANGSNSGGSGLAGLITSPSTQPNYGGEHDSANRYGDTYFNSGSMGNKDNIVPHLHRMRKHLEPDDNITDFSGLIGQRQTERLFMSLNIFDDDGTTSDNVFKMGLLDHYANNGGGGYGGSGLNFTLHNENTYRSDSDVKYYTPTGRGSNNTKPDNNVSMVKNDSMVQVYGDETGTNGGTLYVTAMSDTTETASSQYNPTAHDGGVAEMFRFDEVTANNTHSTNAKIVSSTTTSDSSNTGFDAEDVCIGDLHGDYFGVAWRQGTTAYVSVFELQEQTSDMPLITRVADSINLGTVPNAGRMALARLGNGVAVLTCGNYYRIIKTNTV